MTGVPVRKGEDSEIQRHRVVASPGAGGGGDRELLCAEERGQRGVVGRQLLLVVAQQCEWSFCPRTT